MHAEGRIPFHRPSIGDDEVEAVTEVLRSGWLTTGAECKFFEQEFAAAVGARHAVAVNSCTAALHLALEAAGVRPGDLVLVPTLTFAATAEVVTYFRATPVFVDCERETLNLDPAHAARLLETLAESRRVPGVSEPRPARALVPVHYAGQMADVDWCSTLARVHGVRIVEDAAHAFPAAARSLDGTWRSAGVTAEQTCFSFYANKTITTGEGGMLVTNDDELAARARMMSLHGLSRDAWQRYSAHGSWSYKIVAPGFKYNMTDVAAAIGRVQLRKAARLAGRRRLLAARYEALLGDIEELQLPVERDDRRHAWHLYVVRLRLDRLSIDRGDLIERLARLGIGTSVHWMPLHLHPYYVEKLGVLPQHFPVASAEWQRMISLPLYPAMTFEEQDRVCNAVRSLIARNLRAQVA